MLLFGKLVDETQMGNPRDHAVRDIASKFSIFLPLRAIYFRSYRYETPCNRKSIKLEPLKTIKLEPLKSIKLEPLKSIKPEPLENSESLANVKKEDIYEFSGDSLIEFQPVPSQELNKVRVILPNLKPKIVEFYSCPVSDLQEPCPKYDTEDKVRQHLMLSHKISIQQQMNIFKTIQKQVLTVF